MSFCLADLKNYYKPLCQVAVEVAVTSLVWQLVEAITSAYKAYKICHVIGPKKASAIVCVFYEKRLLKNPLL